MPRQTRNVRPTREQVAKRTVERLRKFSEHLASGKRVSEVYSCRKIVLDIETEVYDAKKVKEVRGLLRISQALFAKFLNVSASAVQKWERGASQPDGAACRLMDEIRCNTDYWRNRFLAMAREVKNEVVSK